MILDHVGWVTNDLKLFEKFWMEILGFRKIFESYIKPEMNKELFGFNSGAYCARYTNGEFTIEVHVYDDFSYEMFRSFHRIGINHVALLVDDRKEFLKKYNFNKRIYHNPKGWDNIFIKDLEGNWIELREKFR